MNTEEKLKEIAINKLGISEEDYIKANEQKDYTQSVPLGKIEVGEYITVKIIDGEVKEMKYNKKNKDNEEYTEIAQYVEVIGADTTKQRLYLSSESLKKEFIKLLMRLNNDVKNQLIKIVVYEYEHDTYGSTRGYNILEIQQELKN